MSKEELLRELGVTEDELRSLLAKLQAFVATLTPNERALFERSQPTLPEALKAFGPSATAENLRHLFGGEAPDSITTGFFLPKPHRPH